MDTDELTKEFFEKAYCVCKEYLQGVWKHLPKSDFTLTRINGGLTNYIFISELPAKYQLIRLENEPKIVLLRFYGIGKLSLNECPSPVLNHLSENLLCAILAERKLGPRLYGVFSGGRIEEYIPARSLTRTELFDGEISTKIAEKMGRLHALNTLPFSKEPNKIFDKMFKWYNTYLSTKETKPNANTFSHNNDVENNQNSSAKISNDNTFLDQKTMLSEIQFCKQIASEAQSPIVFCHFDLQEGNILINRPSLLPEKTNRSPSHLLPKTSNNSSTASISPRKTERRLKSFAAMDLRIEFIDYEYSAYTYRAFDIANHFCEWTIDYTNKKFPYFSMYPDDFPDHDQQLLFITAYLRSYHQAVAKQNCKNNLLMNGDLQLMQNNNDYNNNLNQSGSTIISKDIKEVRRSQRLSKYKKHSLPQTYTDSHTHNDNLFKEANGDITDHINNLSIDDNAQPKGDKNALLPDITQETQHVLQEIPVFVMLSHLLWTFWSLVQIDSSKITFGFQEYAETRFKQYIKCKETYMKTRENKNDCL